MTDTLSAADSLVLKEEKIVKKQVEKKDHVVRKPAYVKELHRNKEDFKVITDLKN